MTALATPPKLQFLDANGAPLVGGKLYTYAAGTTTPLATYTDYGGGTANANPVILDSRGEANVWLGTALYKMALYSATDVLIWTVDNIGGFATLAQLAASGGSNLVGFLQAGTGAVATTVQAKLRESVSVKDFGAVGDGVTDDTAAIALCATACTSGKTMHFPDGTYLVSASTLDACIVLPQGVNLLMERGAWLITNSTAVSLIAPLGDNIITANIDGNGYPTSGGVTGTWTRDNTGIRTYFSAAVGLGADNVIVCNSEIKNCSYGIIAHGAQYWRVYGNKIHRNKQSAQLWGYGTDGGTGYNCQYNVIDGNVFEDLGDYAVAFYQIGGYTAATGAYNVISNNICRNANQRTNGYAYGVEAGDPTYQYNFVFANNVYETDISTGTVTLGGITISTTQDCIVIGNRLKGALGSNGDVGINARSASGQKARRGLIANNHIEGFRGAGVRVDGHDDATVRGNYIVNCGDTSGTYPSINVALTDSSDGQVIENNTLFIKSTYPHYGAGTPAIGVAVAAGKTVSNITIRGNTIINPNDYAIQVSGLVGNLVRGVNILNNSIIGTNDATFFARNPIICGYITEFSILGNTIIDAKRGFSITNSTYGTVGENEVRGSNTLNNIWSIDSSTNILLRNNEVTAPATAVFGSGSSSQLTTPANNNRATGGSGLVVQSKGVTGLIATGGTVSHGLSVTPTNVVIAPADTGVTDFFVSALGASTFTINYSGGGTHAFYWRAEF
jgi:hypothetical protein